MDECRDLKCDLKCDEQKQCIPSYDALTRTQADLLVTGPRILQMQSKMKELEDAVEKDKKFLMCQREVMEAQYDMCNVGRGLIIPVKPTNFAEAGGFKFTLEETCPKNCPVECPEKKEFCHDQEKNEARIKELELAHAIQFKEMQTIFNVALPQLQLVHKENEELYSEITKSYKKMQKCIEAHPEDPRQDPQNFGEWLCPKIHEPS